MRPRSLIFLALMACLAATARPGFPSGKPETRLADARRLIVAKEYDNALRLLIQVAKENKEFHDEAGELMTRIIAIRKEYNKKYETLIEALSVGDVEQGLRIIDELEALDPHPNPATMASLEKARRAAELVFTAKAFRDLMAEALKQIRAKQYSEAIRTYLRPIEHPDVAGFDLQKKDFLKRGYGDILVNSVTGSVSRVTDQAEAARSSDAALQTIIEDVASAQRSDEADQGVRSRFSAALARVAASENVETALLKETDVLDAASRAAAELGGDKRAQLYIKYVLQILGRRGSEGGIVTAARLIQEDAARRMAAAADEGVTSSFARAVALSRTGGSPQAEAAFDLAASRTVMAAEVVGWQTTRLNPAAGWYFTPKDQESLRELAGRAAAYQEIGAECRAYKLLLATQKSLAAMPSAEGLGVDALTAARARSAGALDAAEGQRAGWVRRALRMDSQGRPGAAAAASAASARSLAGRFGELASGIQNKDLSYASLLAESRLAGFPPRLTDLHAARVRAEDTMRGTRDGGQGADEGLPKYPFKAMAVFEETEKGLRTLADDLGTFSSQWGAEKPYVAAGPRVVSARSAADELRKKVLAEADQVADLYLLAQDQHNRAVQQERLGDQAFDQAVALAKRDAERAGEFLTEASDAYGRSLQYEDNPAISARLDKEIRELRERLALAANATVVTEVEGLITEGVKLLTSGDYLPANQKFNQADERWKEKHPGETYSSDLAYYLNLSQNALSVNGSREILRTDPGYDVVSSYINLANKSFREAQRLVQQGKTTAAQPALDSAGQSVASVLALYPNYRVARVLDLRILKLTDEKAFPGQLQKQVDDYMNGLKKGGADKKEVYLGLKNIQEFLPNDRGLASTVEQLEYDLGVKPRPLPPEKIRESTRLTEQAAGNYRKDIPETFQPSLKLLDQALRANPANDDARRLRTAILIRSGSPVEGAVSKKALADYLRAKDLLNSGSINDAKIIVDRLMRDPKNAAYPPLVELKGKIDARLGI